VDYVPETQSGVETGLDLEFGQVASLQITRFDQVASALQQPTGLPGDIPVCAGGCDATQTAAWTFHQSTVVGGAIRNRGWEARGSILLRNLMLTGATAITDSRVLRIADGYAGELRVGDRMLGVPSRTGSLTAEWVHSGWSTAWTLSRAANWVNYDRLRLAVELDSASGRATLGDLNLRDYWATYPGTARLRGTFVVQLPSNTALQVTGENLTNVQTGEPDSITILPGRSIMLGLRARF
jgi:iron complex outermembrane receptor protein